MKLVETTEVETPSEVIILDYFRTTPCQEGIRVEVRSPLLFEWARSLYKGVNGTFNCKWGGKYFVMDLSNSIKMSGNFIWANPNDPIIKEQSGISVVNISWIFHMDLGEGAAFTVPHCSAQQYEDIAPLTKEAIKNVYLWNIRKNIITTRLKEVLK